MDRSAVQMASFLLLALEAAGSQRLKESTSAVGVGEKGTNC